MKAKSILIAATATIGILAGTAIADGHLPVEKREAAMKSFGGASRTIGNMLKGTDGFDAAKANAALAAMKTAATGLGELFPDGTELQGSNQFKAAPAIWTDRAGFDAEIATFAASIDAAVAASPQDKAALAAAFGTIGKSCGSCHEGYRVKQ